VLEPDYLRRGVAEFVGTFALIFVGAGSALYGNIEVAAFANGLVIAVMVS
jgi:glycerol uptake facilitator-like aquaporin